MYIKMGWNKQNIKCKRKVSYVPNIEDGNKFCLIKLSGCLIQAFKSKREFIAEELRVILSQGKGRLIEESNNHLK